MNFEACDIDLRKGKITHGKIPKDADMKRSYPLNGEYSCASS